jgi:hypothetical protein
LFLFRFDVPPLCTFDLRLFTRYRHPTSSETRQAYDSETGRSDARISAGSSEGVIAGVTCAGGVSLGATGLMRPTCSRILRMESLVHTIMTTPNWNMLMIIWNDLMQNWIKPSGEPFVRRLQQRYVERDMCDTASVIVLVMR